MWSSAQNTTCIRKAEKIAWYGLDFTQSKFIGLPENFNDIDKIVSYYFSEWNMIVLRENEKYNLKEYYKKVIVEQYIEEAIENSRKREVSDIVSMSSYSIAEDKVQEIIQNIETESTDVTIGLIYIVESLNKMDNTVAVRVVFFETKSKNILLSRKVIGKARGVGFKNFWMGGFYDVLKISGKKLKRWEKGKS